MAKYRKKPIVIEAVQWLGDIQIIHDFMNTSVVNWGPSDNGTVLFIPTLEGEMRAEKGDWIIKGIKGEFYPCKLDIFEATYEPVME